MVDKVLWGEFFLVLETLKVASSSWGYGHSLLD